VQSNADVSQLNLLRGTNNQEIRGVSPEDEKEGYGGKDLQKRKVLSLE